LTNAGPGEGAATAEAAAPVMKMKNRVGRDGVMRIKAFIDKLYMMSYLIFCSGGRYE